MRRSTIVAAIGIVFLSAGSAEAQRRAGSVAGPVTWQLAASSSDCLSAEEGLRIGSAIRVSPCSAASVNNQAIIYDRETNVLQVASNPALCLMVGSARAGETLAVQACNTGGDGVKAWSFTRARGIWLRDNDGLCLRPEAGSGSIVKLAPCGGGSTNTWSCTAVSSWPAIDGAWPAARTQEWCDR